jgi:hypothetical protein
VRPDEEVADVERERRAYQYVCGLLDRGAVRFDLPLDMDSPIAVS